MQLPILNRASETPIRRQIYEQLKTQILCGMLRAGEALPSTRQLAADLGVSRSTIVESYDMLLAEGFLESRQGSQTVVADGIFLKIQSADMTEKPIRENHTILADFTTGRPDINSFPRAQWIRLLAKAAQELPVSEFGYSGPQGYLPLREEIAAWLSRSRGITASAEDIFITAGATHALRITADLLCPGGGRVIMEDPCHKGLYDTLIASNCEIVPVPVDDHGLRTDLLSGDAHAKIVYVTPSHQFPLGGILPAGRRAGLIRYAQEQNIYIIEDDYDSEFRFTGMPITPLYAMDAQRVIYVGTFSKTVFPALRIGFAILPKGLQARWKFLRMHHDVQNPPFEQAAMAAFLRSRAFDRHIRSSRNRYAKRREVLIFALREAFGDHLSVSGDAAGLHVAVRISGMAFDDSFQARCKKRGIIASPLEAHCIVKGQHMDQLVLGYGHLEPEQIKDGVRLLAKRISGLSNEKTL